ncbi:MAG: hypothetical protein GMKNLPBB_00221 [Myxococcota bacterium]|nr:hypothetical protein [Myxococcota bacterium]
MNTHVSNHPSSPKVDHIGVAVSDLDAAIAAWTLITGKSPDHIELVESQKVKVAMFQLGETRIELLWPTSPDSTVAKFIEKRGEGIHHLCLGVTGIDGRLSELKSAGVPLLHETPFMGAHETRCAFIHPKGVRGVLVELNEPAGESAA